MKSELLRKALMSKMANGGKVGGDDEAKKSAKKVEKVPEGYEIVKDSKGNPVTNEAGNVLYKKESKKEESKRRTEEPFVPKKPKPSSGSVKKEIVDDKGKPKIIPAKPISRRESEYVYLEQPKQLETQTVMQAPENKWAQIWGGERRWSRSAQGMPSIIGKSGEKLKYESIDVPAQWDPKTKKWETAGGWGKPTTLYGIESNGKFEVFDPSLSPVSYTEKGAPYLDYEKLAKTTGEYKKETETALKEGPQRALLGFGEAQPQSFKAEYEPSKDVKQSINTMYGEGGPYVPIQPKKKGGVINKYQGGGTAMAGAGGASSVGTASSGIGVKSAGSSGGLDASKLSPELLSQVGELTGTGIDILDRRKERSSIAGQTGVGALKGAGRGAAMLAPLGPVGMAAGAIGGALIGGVSGAIRGKKEKEQRLADIGEETTEAAIAAQQYDPLNPNAQPQSVKFNKKDTKKGIAGLFAKGGTIKGAGTGTSDSIVTDINKKGIPEGSFITPAKNNEMAKGIRGMVLGQNPNKVAEFKKGGTPNSDKVAVSNGEHLFTPAEKKKITAYLGKEILEKLAPEAEENEMEKKKGGEMIKRADGSYSKRGLWDNIRANIGSGKKPTPEMLKQEKEIKSELKKGGYVVKRSSERKGKTHVVIGPDGTKKYFGDSKLGQHPNDPARKKAFYARHEKNLKKNPYFRAFARETWAEGGTVGSKMNKDNTMKSEMLKKELLKKANGGFINALGKAGLGPNPSIAYSDKNINNSDLAFKNMFAKGGELTKSKAKEILHDKSVHGKPLTDKQRKYFGWVAGGKKNMGGIVGKYAMGGKVNRDWDWG